MNPALQLKYIGAMEGSAKVGKLALSRYINRELSWMAFNDRVLEEAHDTKYPLLERLKFVSIVSSNLDEFFMIRVAGLEKKLARKTQSKSPDGLKIEDVLGQIREWALDQKSRQAKALSEILELLKTEKIYLQTTLEGATESFLADARELLPKIERVTVKSPEVFQQLEGGKIYVFVRLQDRIEILSLKKPEDRLIRLPSKLSQVTHHFVLAERLIVALTGVIYKGEPVLEAFPFKLIRDADVEIDPNIDPDELIISVEQAIQTRKKLSVVRLEVDAPSISDGALALANSHKLPARSVYRYDSPLDLKILWKFLEIQGFEHLKFPSWVGHNPGQLDKIPDLIRVIRQKDLLLHHPYDSFDTVVAILQAAAGDSKVTEIRQTLYRTSLNSPVIDALIQAAKNGKKVSVMIEFRARFDEERNIGLAKELKKHGVKVLKGFSDKKIHCKLTQILRNEDSGVRSYVHVGTGNYNPSTARLYTDLAVLSCNEDFGADAENVFKAFESGKVPSRGFKSFVVAPIGLRNRLMSWIDAEIEHAKQGRPARIVAKINALVDVEVAEALYRASAAGVKVDLIVRGACILRPGVPGLSENIRVVSIVGRYLEHSRIYYFENGGDHLVYLSSADWMHRNLQNRFEIAFPVNDSQLKEFIAKVILETYLQDNQKARVLQPDGHWQRRVPDSTEQHITAQDVFSRLAGKRYEGTSLYARFKTSDKGIKSSQNL
ncbi:MAG: polyphosphate kinase 1 [Oligoflexia bacterium]|nr:polyphosphate kinase 1 [Oligoflexia bacterium]